jgi:hypothetical protein
VAERSNEPSTEAESFDPRATEGGSMGGGASGPRDLHAGGSDEGDPVAERGTQRSSEDVEAKQGPTSPERRKEEIENYGSRREEEPDDLLSPSSQIGRAAQTGGTPESRRDPDVDTREGWPAPRQDDTPESWPDPNID